MEYLKQIYLEFSIYIYVMAGMIITVIMQVYINRKSAKRFYEKVRDGFVCSLLTVAISLPLLQYYPQIPHSITLMIGSIVGTLGFAGWEIASKGIVHFIFNKIGIKHNYSTEQYPIDREYKKSQPDNNLNKKYKYSDSNEPNMPLQGYDNKGEK